nr:zinc finger protein 346 isoform X2 [Chelonoidis abingdonii]
MIRENSHIFTDAQCKVCSAVLISESQKLAHYQSKKHANKVRRYMSIHGEEELRQGKKIKLETKQESSNGEDRNKCCPICNMTFSSPVVAMSHYLGKTHAKNLKLKQQSPRVEVTMPPQKCPANFPPSAVSSNEENQSTSDPDKFCSLCHATFNNPLMAKQHYVGKKHRKQETKLKLMAHYGRTPDAPASSSMGGLSRAVVRDCVLFFIGLGSVWWDRQHSCAGVQRVYNPLIMGQCFHALRPNLA